MAGADTLLEDGDLEIDNGASERANRDIVLRQRYWRQNSSGSEKSYLTNAGPYIREGPQKWVSWQTLESLLRAS
jgi:hypothetical protein